MVNRESKVTYFDGAPLASVKDFARYQDVVSSDMYSRLVAIRDGKIISADYRGLSNTFSHYLVMLEELRESSEGRLRLTTGDRTAHRWVEIALKQYSLNEYASYILNLMSSGASDKKIQLVDEAYRKYAK